MNSIRYATISELCAALSAGSLTVHDIAHKTQQLFQQHDTDIHSAIEVFTPESVVRDVPKQGTLSGIPGLIKDNICQKDRLTTCASRILQGFTSPYDATAVERLKAQGALLVGRANCDEFAMGSSTETSVYGITRNPWDHARVPGGSSGGSAAAVAAGLVPWTLGSDTGGSIRQPAALCGIVGLKPTYGLVSRYGLIAYGSSLDQIGVFTRTVEDAAVVLETIAGHDHRDSTSAPVQDTAYSTHLTHPFSLKGVRIGVIANAFHAEGIDQGVTDRLTEVINWYRSQGADIVEVTLPTLDMSAAVYFMVSRAEAASNLSRFDGVRYGHRTDHVGDLEDMYARTRYEGFGPQVRRRILIGNYVLSAGHADAYYNAAKRVQAAMRQEFVEALTQCDALFLPASPAGAFTLGAFDKNPLQMDLQDYFTAFANLTGVPAITVPCGFVEDGLPTGFQLVGRHFGEAQLLHIAHAYDRVHQWHRHHPRS